MESPAIVLDAVLSPDGSAVADCSLASLRRRAWAKSRESTWQETQKTLTSRPPQEPPPDCTESNGEPKKTSEEPGLSPNKITSWLDQCRTPLAVSLDDQSIPLGKGAPRNGCSFEDDLSLGAEADHLQSSSKTTGSCGSLAADQKRSQYKEKGRSMNSTGSGKSSTVSSVSELLDLYEEDPEEILLNLGFGRDEPDMSSKIPSRFFNSSSAARGIDIKVYLGAQLQRMEVENPNYALTSRFRQIEVLTTVANQFIQLYGHVSGQPVQSVCSFSGSRDQGGGEVTKDQSPPSIFQRRTSAQNVADRLKKSLSKHNLLMASHSPPSRLDDKTPPTLANGHSRQLHDGHSEQDGDEQTAEKHIRKKDSCSLATVTEETSGSGDVEVEQHTHTGQNGPGGEPDFTDTGSTNQSTNEPQASGAEEKSITSNPDKALPNKAPPTQGVAPLSSPLLAQLRTENADSFDMEEIQSNEDEALLSRTSRSSDLLRAVSQQSDSSGFAEEMLSVDASNLKVQESSDSCDSETTVTSHPSHDVATPVALDQPAFDLPDTRVEKSEPTSGATAAAVSNRSSQEQEKNEKCDGNSELVPQYKAHQLPKNIPLKDVRQGGSGPESQENHEQEQTQPLQDDDQRELLSSDPPPLNQLSCNPPCLDLPSLDPPPLNCLPLDPQSSDPLSSNLPSHSPSLDPPPSHHPLSVQAPSPPDHPFNLPTPDSPVLSALSRVKQRLGDAGPRPSRRHHRSGLPLQRSSSLPSSLLSPTRVVSSVKVQLGGGRAFCSQPCYAFRFIQDPNANLETADVPSCISTLVIESTSESDHKYAALPKATPRPLIRSSHSLRSASPPTNWPWITQSVPNLSSKREQFGHDQQGGTPNPGPDIFLSPSPSPRPESPMSTPPVNPSLLYPSFLHPYASLPNLHHHHSNHFPFHQPPMGTPPHYSSLWNLPLGIPPMPHYPAGNYHMAYHSIPHSPPYLGYSGYELSPLPPLAPDHIIHRGGAPPGPGLHPDLGQGHTPHRGLANSSHLGHNLGQSPHPRFGNSSHPGHSLGLHPVVSQGHTSYNGVGNSPHLGHSLGHSPYLGVNPHQSTYTGHNLPHNPHPGFGLLHNPQPSHSLVSSHNPHLGLSPGSCQVLSGTEMQLRRVLHEIRGTVHSLNQQRVETSEIFLEASCQQALETLQQKRRSLGLFRAQMMDLELSIVRQQALVYKHLSPADRLEMEHLISLRSAVREELLELEQQLEDKLMDLTQHAAPGKGVSTDNVSTNSTLRAMEPVSDLLREQFLLQSELNYDDHAASSAPSSVSSFRPRTPTPGVSGDPQTPAVYRAFINITPVPPPRTDRLQYQREEEELGAGEKDEALEEAGAERLCEDNLHHIITETRESVTQEVRQEIFNELMVATGASCLLTRPADP